MEAPILIRELASVPCLRLFTSIPEGHRVVRVRQPAPGSIYSDGMYVVVDPAQTALMDGVDFAVIGTSGPRYGFREMAFVKEVCRGFGGWCLAPGGRGHSQVVGHGKPLRLLDGPMLAEGLQKRIVGRVVGYLGDDWGQPLRELWPEDFGRPLKDDRYALADLPNTYVCETDGNCLAPLFKEGDKLHFSAIDPVEPGDLVALWLKPEFCHEGVTHQVLVKRLVTPLPVGPFPLPEMPAPPIAIVEMDNPKRQMVVPLDRVMAIHKCRGVYAGVTNTVSRHEARAIAEAQAAGAAS